MRREFGIRRKKGSLSQSRLNVRESLTERRKRRKKTIAWEDTIHRQTNLRFATGGELAGSLFELDKPCQKRLSIGKQRAASLG